jgi:replication fork clamp-binding protein CrfC
MAGDPNSGARSPAVQQALSVVDLGVQAATAYKRPDLVDRLRATQRRLADPAFHVFVVGEFKQGKSSLVNALLNAPVCPVDDDIATSVPTAIGYAEQPRAAVQFRAPESEDPDAGDEREPVRQDIPVDQIAQYVTEATNPANQQRVASVEVSLPRKLLADGLVIVDTPGVGGLGSAHSAATIGALPMADAVIFVTDASQEFTAPELDFLKLARRMCPNIICVLTKTDFYPSWRKIRDLDVAHLERAGIKAKLITVSSALRIHALRKNDRNLNQESGFPALVGYLQNDIAANAETLTLRNATNDVVSVCGLIESQFRSERDAPTCRATSTTSCGVASARSPSRPTSPSRRPTRPTPGTSSRPGSTAAWPRTSSPPMPRSTPRAATSPSVSTSTSARTAARSPSTWRS